MHLVPGNHGVAERRYSCQPLDHDLLHLFGLLK
jgi:hypothetical protein